MQSVLPSKTIPNPTDAPANVGGSEAEIERRRPFSLLPGEWRSLAAVGVLFAVVYFSTFVFMIGRWIHDENYQHGFLVIPIAAWVVWAKREKLACITRSSSPGGLWMMGTALALHLLEQALDLNGPSPLSVPLFIGGAVLYLFGKEFLKELSFPIAYLFFMVPIPGGLQEPVTFPLRLLATNLAKVVVGLFGVKVNGAGMDINFTQLRPGGEYIKLTVADACSGLHSVMAIKALHAITAYLTRLKVGWKWVLFMCAIPVALTANLTRIVGIVLIGAYGSRELALGLFHDYSTYILFAIAFSILISLGRLMEWATEPRKPRTTE